MVDQEKPTSAEGLEVKVYFPQREGREGGKKEKMTAMRALRLYLFTKVDSQRGNLSPPTMSVQTTGHRLSGRRHRSPPQGSKTPNAGGSLIPQGLSHIKINSLSFSSVCSYSLQPGAGKRTLSRQGVPEARGNKGEKTAEA